MKRRLLALAAIGLVVIFMTRLATSPPPQPRLVQTNGPLVLVVTGRTMGASNLTIVQVEGMTEWFAMTPSAARPELTNSLMIQLTNRGNKTVEMWAYNSASPMYGFYVDGTNGMKRLESAQPEVVPARIYLGPTQSLTFPVLPPVTDRPWRVCVSYRDYVRTAPLTFPSQPPTALENLVVRIREFVPFLRKPEPGFYYTMSEVIAMPERMGSTTQPEGGQAAEASHRP